jgi:hypothetical protein
LRPIASGSQERVDWRGQDYLVRRVAGEAAAKVYRCPGCDQEIGAGVAHVVAWPDDGIGAQDRRHWHTGCWNSRDTRAPGTARSRNAPRY